MDIHALNTTEFKGHQTMYMSGIYMPFILHADNNGIPTIDLLLPPDIQPQYMQFVNRLRRSPSLTTLCILFQMLSEPFHLPALIQHANG